MSTSDIWSLREQYIQIAGGNWATAPVVPYAFDPGDEYFENATLLLKTLSTDGAQNNTFLDSSSNNFTITRNGNTTQGSFSPYRDRWSNYFDGTGDYLTAPNDAALDFGSGDFTIEFWANLNSLANFTGILSKRSAENVYSPFTIDASDGKLRLLISTTGSSWAWIGLSSTAFPLNEWVHFAAVRNGTSFNIYQNGTSVASTTVSGALMQNTSAVTIGRSAETIVNSPEVNGYISDVRIVKGTALYTANFTPPTAPLTAVSGTSLLTCQSNLFKDNSSNDFAITVNGNTKVTPFSPYAPTAAYNPASDGGSGYFDGTGDYLGLDGGSSLTFGTGDFTFEMWVYLNSLAGSEGRSAVFIDFRTANGTAPLLYTPNDGSGDLIWYINSTAVITGSAALSINTWKHIAVSRSSGSTRMFVDGIQVGSTYADTINYSVGANRPFIGSNGTVSGGEFNGYASDLRIIKGTAVYTSNFTPPTAPLTAVSGTSLLCSFTNAGIYDATGMNVIETVNDAQIDTAVVKFDTGSMEFDGAGDYLSIPLQESYYLNSSDFTLEFWINANSTSSAGVLAFPHNASNYAHILVFLSSGNLLLYSSDNGTSWSVANGAAIGAISTSQWYHVAITREGSSIRTFVNGVLGSTTTYSGTFGGSYDRFWIGDTALNNAFNGFIEDLRITKGVARYTANFTPPAASFKAYGDEVPVDYIIVAGGGGGGQSSGASAGGGGGGAGGFISSTSQAVSLGVEYTVTIGAGGGVGSTGTDTAGSDGGDSSFNSETATGGGGGGTRLANGRAGGSGGGGGSRGGTGGTGISGQGNDGGNGSPLEVGDNGGGGGGGAGQTGFVGVTNSVGGDGGDGLQSSITGTATYYAGGGGGGISNDVGSGRTGGIGGLGGGGNGGTDPADATAGTANTGGGGGGAAYSSSSAGTGGSGVVIIRAPKEAASTTGSPTFVRDGGFAVYTFTGSGSITF